MKGKILRILTVLAILTVLVIPLIPLAVGATGATYYVSTTGNDSNVGSLASPWLTFYHAWATATSPGDTVNFEAGTYTSAALQMDSYSGTPGNPITFRNYGSDVVNLVWTGGGYYGLGTYHISYIDFIGLRFSAPTCDYDLNLYGGDHIIVQNCYFGACLWSGISAEQGFTYLTIDGCEITGTNTAANQEMISLFGVNHFEIKNCNIHAAGNNQRIGICIKNDDAVESQNGLIHNNAVHDLVGYLTADGIYTAAGSHNIDVYDNLVYNCAGAGLVTQDEYGVRTPYDITWYNNIVYNCTIGFFLYQTGTETYTDITVINNTFYHNGLPSANAEIYTNSSSTYCTNIVIRNNIIDSGTAGNYGIEDDNSVFTVDHNLFYNSGGSWNAGNVLGTNYIEANPLLTSPTTDFSLTFGSPAINTGSATSAPATDYIGTARPQGAGYDIGAYEYIVGGTISMSTTAAGTLTSTSARMHAQISNMGGATSLATAFEYGLTTGYTASIAGTANPMTSAGTFYADISGLTPGTTYHFQAIVSDGVTLTYGGDLTFTTTGGTTTTSTTSTTTTTGITTTTTPTTPTPISTSIAQDIPIVFGILLIITMFITAITTRSVSAVITATIICLLGIFGIVLLENLILSIFGNP